MTANEILDVLVSQLKNNFALSAEETKILEESIIIQKAYDASVECLKNGTCRYFNDNTGISAFISDAYCNYLYWLSHLLYKQGYETIASKVYYLNKMLNCVELFYAIELPQHWYCEHPLGAVMGRAKYGDYFFFDQGCTIGGNHQDYPVLGNNVTMYSNSKVIGKSHIGNNVSIAANAYVKDTDIPSNMIVFGQYPNLILKPNNNIDIFWK